MIDDEESFENEISRLKLDGQEGKAFVKMLNPASNISRYHSLATPKEMHFHVLVVPPIVSVVSMHQLKQILMHYPINRTV